jgi:pantoate--beta-alanine ligase
VVTKLVSICQPDRAYFGEKDAQQLAVIERMVRDLDLPVEVVPCAIVREQDGLAMSSRNVRLTPEARAQAPVLYRSLRSALEAIEGGERDAAEVITLIRAMLAEAPLGEVDYVEVVDAGELIPVQTLRGTCLIALAVRFGPVRLIDNVRVTV